MQTYYAADACLCPSIELFAFLNSILKAAIIGAGIQPDGRFAAVCDKALAFPIPRRGDLSRPLLAPQMQDVFSALRHISSSMHRFYRVYPALRCPVLSIRYHIPRVYGPAHASIMG